MTKIHPFSYPIITSYPAISNELAVIYHDIPHSAPWLVNNYIQLVSYLGKERKNEIYGSFYEEMKFYHLPIQATSPYIYTEIVNRYTNNIDGDSVICYVKNMINNNYYIEIFVDNYYIKVSDAFKTYHKKHPILIYGYSDDEQLFYVADFFKGPFSCEKIEYREFLESYINDDETEFPFLHQCFRMFRYHQYPYKIDIELIKIYVNDYLECKDTFKRHLHLFEFRDMQMFYGLNYYEATKIHLNSIRTNIDHRLFQVFVDHKTLMKFRIDYLSKNDYIKNEHYNVLKKAVEELHHRALTLRNKVLKFNISHRELLMDNIIVSINDLKILDEKCMSLLSKCL